MLDEGEAAAGPEDPVAHRHAAGSPMRTSASKQPSWEDSLPHSSADSLWESFDRDAPPKLRYELLAGPSCEASALRLQALAPDRFRYHKSSWGKFQGETGDNIELGGFTPVNCIRGRHVLLIANFEDNDVTLSQFHAMIVLLQSFIESLTVLLPFYPVGTMEVTHKEGQVATANTTAQLFGGLPSCGKPVRLMIYDLHTLQNRFYFSNHVIGDLVTTVPLCLSAIKHALPSSKQPPLHAPLTIDAIAFPDAGASKRFGAMFPGYPIITCSKVRSADNQSRIVTVADGIAKGMTVLIVDDLVRTGGTLAECGKALREHGAKSVSAFCAHGVFPGQSWKRFLMGGDRQFFDFFFITNSIEGVTNEIMEQAPDDCFKVLEIEPLVLQDL